MLRLGFHENWVKKIMGCVDSVTYRLKINCKLYEVTVSRRGLRQGDPLSSYLFLLCQEWFSSQLNLLQDMKKVEGISIARGVGKLNQLFFADDYLLFVKAELMQIHELKKVFIRYETILGSKSQL